MKNIYVIPKFICQFCNKDQKTQSDLDLHLENHKCLFCRQCLEKNLQKRELVKHINGNCKNDQNIDYYKKCNVCLRKWLTNDDFSNHKCKRKPICLNCDKDCLQIRYLRRHLNKNDCKNKYYDSICKKCQYICIDESDLTEHVCRTKNYICQICDKNKFRKRDLEEHLNGGKHKRKVDILK